MHGNGIDKPRILIVWDVMTLLSFCDDFILGMSRSPEITTSKNEIQNFGFEISVRVSGGFSAQNTKTSVFLNDINGTPIVNRKIQNPQEEEKWSVTQISISIEHSRKQFDSASHFASFGENQLAPSVFKTVFLTTVHTDPVLNEISRT